MAAYEQLPGTLPLAFKAGDDFSALVDFSLDMTGYAVSASLLSIVTGSQVVAITASITNAASGQVNVSLSDTQTSAIQPGTYRWVLVGTQGAATRTLLEGHVEVVR